MQIRGALALDRCRSESHSRSFGILISTTPGGTGDKRRQSALTVLYIKSVGPPRREEDYWRWIILGALLVFPFRRGGGSQLTHLAIATWPLMWGCKEEENKAGQHCSIAIALKPRTTPNLQPARSLNSDHSDWNNQTMSDVEIRSFQ